MIDKIRLHAAGKLPADYVRNLGEAKPGVFDARCCTFLGVTYAALAAKVPVFGDTPADDEKLIAWAHANGTPRTDDECDVWNQFMRKRGWRDQFHERLAGLVAEGGSAYKGMEIETFFDLFDAEEGRNPADERRRHA